MQRYGCIDQKRKREIVLLRGKGCAYRKCTFCDYYTDACGDTQANFLLNRAVLDRVTGKYGDLEVINSGSVFELDEQTLAYIGTLCRAKGIRTLHFEAHWLYRDRIAALRTRFADVAVKMKLGLETFDSDFRENVLHKGIATADLQEICRGFDEANLLFGIAGQSISSMRADISLGLRHFERLCVNVMCKNATSVVPDEEVVSAFMREIYPEIKENDRIDVLVENTDFGVGGAQTW